MPRRSRPAKDADHRPTGGTKALLSVRDHILDRTIYLIGKRGTTDVTVREIAREAGVNVAAVNYYFSSKEQMFAQMGKRFLDGYDEVMGLLETPGVPAEQRLRQWSEEVMRQLAVYPGILALMERYVIAEPLDAFGGALRDATRQAIGRIRATLEECIGPMDEERIGFKLMLLISALAGPFPHHAQLTPGQRQRRPSSRAHFVDLLLEHLKR